MVGTIRSINKSDVTPHWDKIHFGIKLYPIGILFSLNYEKIINIEKRIACGADERMKSTDGFELPSFDKKANLSYLQRTPLTF